jgi:hypothetical protein
MTILDKPWSGKQKYLFTEKGRKVIQNPRLVVSTDQIPHRG